MVISEYLNAFVARREQVSSNGKHLRFRVVIKGRGTGGQ